MKIQVEKLLEEKYKPDSGREDAIKLALISLNSVSEGKIKAENVDIITIEVGGKYQPVKVDYLEDLIKKLGKELETTDENGE